MTNICVIGAGTAGVISMLALINKLQGTDYHVTCIYDPDIPTIQVGESTSTAVLELLKKTLDFRVLRDLEPIDGTVKYGVKYQNWSDEDFFVHHADPAIHLNSAKFSYWALNKIKQMYPKNYTEIHTTVDTLDDINGRAVVNNQHVFDIVIDCRGFPKAEDFVAGKYSNPIFTSVNSVIIFPEFKKYDEMYSTSYATKHGWMFGIPLTHRKAWGYLYNNELTTQQEAIEDFKQIRNLSDDDIQTTRQFSWTSFYKKEAMHGPVLYSGNKLIFFEPGQGLALHYYLVLADYLGYLILNTVSLDDINKRINEFHLGNTSDFQDLIAMNYNGVPKYQSKFWDHCKIKSTERLKSPSSAFKQWARNPDHYRQFNVHSNEIMHYLINGFKVNIQEYANAY